ncbi:DHH family phosphoesterase [Candidatus Woesearchaeota archaeon]|nr:DHH family phosphoesterase [Candidatus Woesearchaeota archaeon]
MHNFLESIKNSAEKFKSISPKFVRIISHLDTDGLCSAAILIATMQRLNINFSLSILTQLDEKIIEGIQKESCSCIIFSDLGSSQLNFLSGLHGKDVFILDHHKPREAPCSFTHVNPHLFEIDGGFNISGAGVSYLFAKALDEQNIDLAHIAIIGAIGDFQENNGFRGLNDLILKDAILAQKIIVKTGLKIFGAQTRSLAKAIQLSTEPYIPGVTGFENASIEFLKSLNISPQKKLPELTQEELQKLVTAIIMKRMSTEDNPEDVLGNLYYLNSEPEDSPIRDLREFSTLLNATGRLKKSSLGIGTLLNDSKIKAIAINTLNDYKKELLDSLNWFYNNRKTNSIVEGKNYVIINGGDNIKETIVATLAMMICKSNLYKPATYIMAIAYTFNNEIKVSMRMVSPPEGVDLRKPLQQMIERVGSGEMGGHSLACGGVIKLEYEPKLIAAAKEVFEQYAMEL